MTVSVINGLPSTVRKSCKLHLLKQALATFASCLLSLSGGATLGFSAVLLPQIQADTDFPYDKEYDSWIASVSPLAMMFGCAFSGLISDAIGRRRGQIFLIFPFILGWCIMGIAKNNATMLSGRFITGLCTGAVRPLGMVYIGEISDPKYRGSALFCPALATFVGSLICHTVGSYISWRISCFVFAMPLVLCLITLFLLKESPLWLLAKGKTQQGIESFKWFRGKGETADKELKDVLDNQDKEKSSTVSQFKSVIFTKPFLKSIATMFFVFLAVQLCGINTITFYAEYIFKHTFGGDVDAFMLMIATDVIRVICTGAMILLARILPRKMTFLWSCFGTTIILVGLCIYLYIKPRGLVWLAVTCLVVYTATASALTSISWSFVAEIFPSKVRGLGSGISSLMSFSLLFISVKVTPSIMLNFGEVAVYGSFAAVTLVSGLGLSFILPETNGRSLQDIENSLYHKNKNTNPKDLMNTPL